MCRAFGALSVVILCQCWSLAVVLLLLILLSSTYALQCMDCGFVGLECVRSSGCDAIEVTSKDCCLAFKCDGRVHFHARNGPNIA